MAVTTLKENIAGTLTDAIFTGKLKPGERLNESQLSRELKVSRAPIREALQHLQEQGLVMNSPRRGMFVVLLEDDDIAKINSVRLVLEAECFRLARKNMVKSDETRLLHALDRLEQSEAATPAVRARYDFDFHRAIWRLCGNDYLERTLHGLTAPLFAHAVLRIILSEQVRLIVRSHRPLMNYLQNKSDITAEELIADHLNINWVRQDKSATAPA
jgi:hypothetical protein